MKILLLLMIAALTAAAAPAPLGRMQVLKDQFLPGRLSGLLPDGAYRFGNAPHDARLAALAFALGAYRFSRYRKADDRKIRLVVPDDVDAPPADAKRTPSGLAYKILKRGKGKDRPTAASTVEVHYSGWTRDGKMFDSSVQRGKPASFPLSGVIAGWTEGVQLMVVGDKARFWIPSALAYGDTPSRPGAPVATLVFDIELLAIK